MLSLLSKRNASAHFFDVGDMDRTVDGLETTGIGFGGFDSLDNWATAFDGDFALGSIHKEHGAALAFMITCDDFDLIAFFDVGLDAAHEIKIVWS